MWMPGSVGILISEAFAIRSWIFHALNGAISGWIGWQTFSSIDQSAAPMNEATFIFGAWIYTKYRISIRIPLERIGYWKTLGFFELKEHVTTLGLGLLPAYWYFWHNARNPAYDGVRKWLTVLLAAMCWFAFLVGHVLNNARGFGS